ncbi:MAG: hypothetical protein KF774_14070 [Planctomyces sp.]|nr:hypothetical protein [Planctomyces sp.]
MHAACLSCVVLTLAVPLAAVAADIKSGPEPGTKVPALKVTAVTGEFARQTIDYPARREGKPTIYLLIPATKWDRPAARLMRQIDQDLSAASAEAEVVAIWVTADLTKTQEYLPLAQRSLQLDRTSLAAYSENPTGPPDWKLGDEAVITAVVAKDGVVKATFGFDSPNETLAAGVIEELKKE